MAPASRLRAAVCFLASLSLARAAPADPDPGQAALDELVRALDGMKGGGNAGPEAARRVAELASAVASTPEGVAALLESGRFEVKVPVGAKVEWPGGEAGVELSGGTVTGTLPLAPMTSLQASVGERKLGVGTTTKVLDLGGTEVTVGGGVEAEYATNKDFYAALPVPGLRHMHALLERRLGAYDRDQPSPEARVTEGWGVREAVEAAATEARDAFQSAVGWVVPEKATFESSVSVRHGPVEVSSALATQVSFAQPENFLRQTSEVTLEVSKEAALGGATVGGGLSFTYRFDERAKPTPEALELAKAIRGGDGARATEVLLAQMGPIAMTEADLALAREVYEKAKDAVVLASGQVIGTADPIGGVSLHFSPTVTGAGTSPAEYGRVLREISRMRREGRSGFALQEGGSARLVRAPLARAATAADLGLTRIRGYVLARDGTIDLVGEDEPGRERIPRDYLVVALRAVFVEGLAPFVSLDPDPRDFSGAQKVRVGGLPAGLEKTAFVRVMLDADHLMKRLDLGRLDVSAAVPDYRSSVDLLETWPDPPKELMSRLWLVPEVAPVGDAYRFEDERGSVVLFHSRVRVLTETLRRAGSTLLGAGESHPMAEAAAASLSAFLPRLARLPDCADFARLEQVFDAAKLCAVWRAAGVKHDAIRALAALTPATVDHPETYAGIGPVAVRGGTYFLSGGASGRARLRDRAPHPLPALAGLLAAGAAEVALPSALPLDGGELHQANAELLANAGLLDVLRGEYAKALEQLDRAVKEEPDLDVAYAYRALARLSLGDFAPALADVAVAARREPALRALEAFVEACAGRAKEALAACDAVEARFADDADLMALSAHARILAGDFEGGERAAVRVDAATPLSHDSLALRDLLETIYRDTPEAAARATARLREIPLAVQNAVALGQEAMASFAFAAAVEHFRAALQAATTDDRPPVRNHHVRELCRYLLVHALNQAASMNRRLDPEAAAREEKEAQELARALVDEHPEWTSLRLTYAKVAGDALTTRERLDLLERAANDPSGDDPFLAEMRRALGTRRVVALFALSLLMDQGKGRGSRGEAGIVEALRFMELLVRTLGDAPEAPPYRLLRDLMKKVASDPKAPEPKPAALRPFVDAILAVPQPWPDDALSVLALSHLHLTGFGFAASLERDDPATSRDLARRLSARFFAGCRINGLREGTLKQVSTLYWTFAMTVASSLSDEVRQSEAYRAIEARVATGIPDVAAVRRDLAAARAALLDARRNDFTPFSLALAESLDGMGIGGLESRLRDRFEESIESLPADAQERAREVARSWREESGARMDGQGPFANIGAVAEKATCEVELASVLNLLEVFGTAMDLATGAGADAKSLEAAGRMRAVSQAVQTRIRGRVFERPARDWAAWRAGTLPVSGPASIAATPASSSGGAPAWLWPAAVVALLAVVGVAAVLRRKRRPAP